MSLATPATTRYGRGGRRRRPTAPVHVGPSPYAVRRNASPEIAKNDSSAPTIAILFLALVLRLYHVNAKSLWQDEGSSLFIAQHRIPDVIRGVSLNVHPPLYHVTLHYWLLLNQTVTWFRLYSVVFGMLAMWLTYVLATRMFDRRTGLIAGLLVATSTFQIFYAQEGRMYTLAAFLMIAAALGAWMALVEQRPLGWVLYSIAATLLLYTHYYGLFGVATLGGATFFWLLVTGDPRRRGSRLVVWLVSHIAVLVLFLPWTKVLLSQTAMVEAGYWTPPVQPGGVMDVLRAYGEYTLGTAYGLLNGPAGVVPYLLLFLALCGIGAAGAGRGSLLCALAIAPIVMAYGVSFHRQSIFVVRYFFPFSAFFLILVAVALARLPRPSWRTISVVVFVVATLPALWSLYFDPGFARPRLVDAALQIRALYQQGDVIVHAQPSTYLVVDWYNRKQAYPDIILPDLNMPDESQDHRKAALRALTAGYHRAWLVVPFEQRWPPAQHDADVATVDLLAPDLKLDREWSYLGVNLYLVDLP